MHTKQEKEKGIEMIEGLVLFFAGDLCGARLRGDDHGAADWELHDGRDGGDWDGGKLKYSSEKGQEMQLIYNIAGRN